MDTLDKIFAMKTIAVVGCSPKPERPSHYVSAYLKSQGYRIIPVNPGHAEILGEKCYPSLSAIPGPEAPPPAGSHRASGAGKASKGRSAGGGVDVVLVFRRPEEVYPVIVEAVRIGAKALWLQDGITHPQGEALAREQGLLVVSDDCMMRQHHGRGPRKT